MLGFVILVLLKKLGLLAEMFRLLLRIGFNKKLKKLISAIDGIGYYRMHFSKL